MVMSLESFDTEVKELLYKVALVCLSEEFNQLRNELEGLYKKYHEENPPLSAFQDALFTILNQEENSNLMHFRAN